MSTPNANDFLMGGGTKSAAFPTIGTTVSGRIVRTPEVRQQVDPKDNSPKTFKNGDPMLQLIVQLQTDERDPQDRDDDGVRALYVKANMLNALRDAVRKSGAKGLDVGGTITVTYTGDGEKTNPAFNPPKLYSARYAPPTTEAANNLLMGGNAGNGSAAYAHGVAAATTTAPAAAVVQPAPAGTPPTGIDPTLWQQLSPEQRASVLAAASNIR